MLDWAEQQTVAPDQNYPFKGKGKEAGKKGSGKTRDGEQVVGKILHDFGAAQSEAERQLLSSEMSPALEPF